MVEFIDSASHQSVHVLEECCSLCLPSTAAASSSLELWKKIVLSTTTCVFATPMFDGTGPVWTPPPSHGSNNDQTSTAILDFSRVRRDAHRSLCHINQGFPCQATTPYTKGVS